MAFQYTMYIYSIYIERPGYQELPFVYVWEVFFYSWGGGGYEAYIFIDEIMIAVIFKFCTQELHLCWGNCSMNYLWFSIMA